MTERGKRITGERAKRSTRMCGIDKCQQVGAVAKQWQIQRAYNLIIIWIRFMIRPLLASVVGQAEVTEEQIVGFFINCLLQNTKGNDMKSTIAIIGFLILLNIIGLVDMSNRK